MDADAVTQHTAPVSSNSPQKELDFKPTVWWAFFSPFDEIGRAARFPDNAQGARLQAFGILA
ncbi:hypothetical protein [Massilia terrae]|uniref:Uncharacterized protein n=1 Tax=Massilia terrae TaxID=1811224 RepID=A0ABT2D5F5_9BURK|nr:hypothetical protein [Massilia terrae]MCS0660996.1 hypothetical protein [Massilia terrae]